VFLTASDRINHKLFPFSRPATCENAIQIAIRNESKEAMIHYQLGLKNITLKLLRKQLNLNQRNAEMLCVEYIRY
jgi:hypothetical protein